MKAEKKRKYLLHFAFLENTNEFAIAGSTRQRLRKIEFRLQNEAIACCTTIHARQIYGSQTLLRCTHKAYAACKNSNTNNSIWFVRLTRQTQKPQNLLLRQNKNVIYYVFYCHYAYTLHSHTGSGTRRTQTMKLYKLSLALREWDRVCVCASSVCHRCQRRRCLTNTMIQSNMTLCAREQSLCRANASAPSRTNALKIHIRHCLAATAILWQIGIRQFRST